MSRRLLALPLLAAAAFPVLAARQAPGQAPGPPTTADPAAADWRHNGRDLANTRYAPFDLIDRDTLDQLRVVWRWKSNNFSVPAEGRNSSTPLMVGGTLYFTTGQARWIIAADAATGATKWTWHLDEGDRGRRAPRRGSGRGVAYWNAGGSARIFAVTPGFQLVSLDAATGLPDPAFGTDGIVDLKASLGVDDDALDAVIGSSSPPLVFEDVVVVGPALELGTRPPSRHNIPGRVMAFDARTGALAWRFNTIPVAGEPGYDTWEDGSADYTGNAGAWAPLALDEARGYLYLPLEAATGDYYGGHRHGDNLYSSTLVCLDARTGRRVWHFQTVHHDIWDWDNPTGPILADVTIGGRPREVVVQLTKQAFAYVLDRETGEPVWPIAETSVPETDVPGEKTSPTQPIPSRPAPYDRQGVTEDDLIDFTPALRAEALEAVKDLRLGRLFSPPSLAEAPDGTRGTLVLPGNLGGSNWEPSVFDPETGVLYVGSWTNPTVLALAPDPQRSDMDYVGALGRVPNVQGLPLIKPPYSRITAIDLSTGDHLWMAANGDTPEAIAGHPALAGLDLPATGARTRPMLLVTKSLLWTADGYRGAAMLRALDKATGERVWQMPLPGTVGSPPMTYMIDGRQFILMWTTDLDGGEPAELIAISTPEAGGRGRGGRGRGRGVHAFEIGG
jgi:quinoprotein glucose dehydrogenase